MDATIALLYSRTFLLHSKTLSYFTASKCSVKRTDNSTRQVPPTSAHGADGFLSPTSFSLSKNSWGRCSLTYTYCYVRTAWFCSFPVLRRDASAQSPPNATQKTAIMHPPTPRAYQMQHTSRTLHAMPTKLWQNHEGKLFVHQP